MISFDYICRRQPQTDCLYGMKNADRRIDIMGIVNVTDNSFFAGSRCLGADGMADVRAVRERVRQMISEGATIIDIGACSTKPGSEPVSRQTEWERLKPVLESVWEDCRGITLSIDTFRSETAMRTFGLLAELEADRPEYAGCADGAVRARKFVAGRLLINDISAGEDDPAMLGAVGAAGLGYVAMHKRGTPQTMQDMCDYADVTCEVAEYFTGFAARAEKAGIRNWILDPGFGFAKTVAQNYELLRNLERFSEPFGGSPRRVLVGLSRKSMIYKLFGITPEESLPQTQVLDFAALLGGADILRVHDVAEAARTVAIYSRLRSVPASVLSVR